MLGAVKTNVGHLDGASGIVGIIKSIMLLQIGVGPANLHLRTLNSSVAMPAVGMHVPTEALTLVRTMALGVSSFGFGGTNAHLIMSGRTNRDRTPSAGYIVKLKAR